MCYAKNTEWISAGKAAGPFKKSPTAKMKVSPLDLFAEKETGEFRHSLTDFIDPILSSVQYTSVDEAVVMVYNLGQGCLLVKFDITSTFGPVPVFSINLV